MRIIKNIGNVIYHHAKVFNLQPGNFVLVDATLGDALIAGYNTRATAGLTDTPWITGMVSVLAATLINSSQLAMYSPFRRASWLPSEA